MNRTCRSGGPSMVKLTVLALTPCGSLMGSQAAFAQGPMPQVAVSDLPACSSDNMAIPKFQVVTLPSLGEEHEVEVGGSLVATARAGIAEASLKITAEATGSGKRAGAGYTITIEPIELPAASVMNNGLHPVRGASFRYNREKGERRGLSKPDISVYVDPANDALLRAKVNFGLSSQDIAVPGARFTVSRCLKMNTNGFRREILYSGGSKGTLHLQYREFMNDLARPAFSQELSYDLADGNEIGFKGARIRVLKLSNVGLRYVVLKALPDQAEQ